MLSMKRLLIGSLAAVLATGAMLIGAAGPASAQDCHYEGPVWVCDVVVTNPGDPGTSNPGTGTGPADFTPGPSKCVDNYTKPAPTEIPCNVGNAWFDNERQCYWSLDDPQGPTTTHDPSVGAWYTCTFTDARCPPAQGCFSVPVWRNTPPPGINRYTPAQAAGALAKTFVLSPIEIGMAPELKVHTDDPPGTAPYRRTWVGIPVWLWVNNPAPTSWGPQSKTATLGGVTVTANASVQSLYWNSGDGQNVTCGAGTPFNAAAYANQAAVDSPTCGIRYQHTTKGGTFTVTATTSWVVQWTGGGQSGQIQMPTTTSTTDVRVGELQSVNVTTTGDTYN